MKIKQSTILRFVAMGAFAACALAAAPVHGASVIVGNHSFETTDIASGTSSNSTGSPWRRTNASTIGLQDRNSGTLATRTDPTPDATDAEQMLYINSAADSVYQVLAATLLANTTYTITVDVGDRTDLTFQSSQLRLGYVDGTDTGSGGDGIANSFYGEFLLTPTVVANTTPVNGAGASDGWQTWVSTFTTGAMPAGLDKALRIEIVGSGTQSLFDNVRLDAVTIPEPSAALLGGLGLLALLRRRR